MAMGTVGRIASMVGIAAVGVGVGAGIAALTPTRDEAKQTVGSLVGGGLAIAAGYGLMRLPGRDGNIVGVLVGALGVAGGIATSGAALGSYLLDRSN